MRSLLLGIGLVLAMSVGAAAGGWSGYEADPVLHPGIVIVSNNTSHNVTFHIYGNLAAEGSYWLMSPGQSWHSTRCCFAAGTEYEIVVDYRTRSGAQAKPSDKIYFRPRLCNRNAVPYGFAHLLLTDSGNHFVDGCYEGPLKT